MPESAVQTFFAIPELVILLSLHILKQDLPRWILVCKDWSRHFEPVLWRDLFIRDRVFTRLSTVPPLRLARNLRYIQEVTFHCANDAQLQLLTLGLPYHLGRTVNDPGAGCTNLKYINMVDLDDKCLEHISRPLVTLLEYNPHLTRLDVPHDFFDIDGVSAAVSRLWHLQHLTVHCSPDEAVTIQKPFLCLQACLGLPELTKLTFDTAIDMDWDHGEQTTVVRQLEAIINDAVMARFSQNPTAKMIKILRLPSRLSGISNPLPLLLMKSKLLDLETCEIPWFRGDVTTQEIEQVVREHCPNLKHLECPDFVEGGIRQGCQDGRAARAFIRGCSGLHSFTSAYFREWPARGILSELVTHHYLTLEVFELTDPVDVYSRNLQRVLSQCKRLKRYWVMDDKDNDQYMASIAFRDIFRSDWVCTELRELGMIVNRSLSGRDVAGHRREDEEEEEEDPDAWLTANSAKRAYQQIGQLKKLKVLTIDIDRTNATNAKEQDYAWDLTLWTGWLGDWAGLKNLRSLGLRADFWSCMGQEEVEFMHEHWPKLNEIVFSGASPEFYTKEPWQWLRQKRPNLRFKAV